MMDIQVGVLSLLALAGLGFAIWERRWPRSSPGPALELTLLTLAVVFAGFLGLRGAESPQGIALYRDGLARVMGGMLVAMTMLSLLLRGQGPKAAPLARSRSALELWALFGALLSVLAADLTLLWIGLQLYLLASVFATPPEKAPLDLVRTRRLLAPLILGLGVALVYLSSGTVDMNVLTRLLWEGRARQAGTFFAGLALVAGGAALATGLLPPYEMGIDSPRTESVILGVALLARLFLVVMGALSWECSLLLAAIGTLAVVWGGLGALLADEWPRRLVHLDTLQCSFLLFSLSLASTELGLAALLANLLAYGLAQSALQAGLRRQNQRPDKDVPTLGWLRADPITGASLLISLLSLMGIMFTLGFVGRFNMLLTAQRQDAWWPVAIVLLASVVAAVRYVPLILGLFRRPDGSSAPASKPSFDVRAGLLISLAGLLILGVLSAPLALLARWIVAG